MLRRRCDRSYGLGPLFFQTSGDGAPGGDPSGGAPATPPATPPAGGAPTTPPAPATPPTDQSVPYARFKEVNDELQARKRADEERETAEATKRGEHEKVAQAEKAKREEAEAKALRVARRAAFVAGASGKVSDIEAAYKLALADGDLDKVEVDDDGMPKDAKAVEQAITDLTKRYEFLKVDSRSFGGDRGGQQPGGGGPSDPKTAQDMLATGYAAIGDPRRR